MCIRDSFQHRFKEGSLDGHSFGNLFIMAMAEITGDFEHAIRESGRVLAVRGKIVPSTLHDVTLIAEMADGETRVGGPGSRTPTPAVTATAPSSACSWTRRRPSTRKPKRPS